MTLFGITIPAVMVSAITRLVLLGSGFNPRETLIEQFSDYKPVRGKLRDILRQYEKSVPGIWYQDEIGILNGAVGAAEGNRTPFLPNHLIASPPPDWEARYKAGAMAYDAMGQKAFESVAKKGIRGLTIRGWKTLASEWAEEARRKCFECDEHLPHSAEGDICESCQKIELQAEVCCERCAMLGLGHVHAAVLRDVGTTEKYLCSPCSNSFPHYPYCPICAEADEAPPEHSWAEPVSDNPSEVPALLFFDACSVDIGEDCSDKCNVSDICSCMGKADCSYAPSNPIGTASSAVLCGCSSCSMEVTHSRC